MTYTDDEVSCMPNKAPTTAELPHGLRIADVVAKVAHVSLKDTLRVMASLDAISYNLDLAPVDLLDACTYSISRPAPENVAACEAMYFSVTHSDDENVLRCLDNLKKAGKR